MKIIESEILKASVSYGFPVHSRISYYLGCDSITIDAYFFKAIKNLNQIFVNLGYSYLIPSILPFSVPELSLHEYYSENILSSLREAVRSDEQRTRAIEAILEECEVNRALAWRYRRIQKYFSLEQIEPLSLSYLKSLAEPTLGDKFNNSLDKWVNQI